MNCLSKKFYKSTVKVYFYLIKCGIDEKIYIGQTIDIKERWKRHRKNAKSKSKKIKKLYLYRAMHKHGIENFKFEQIPIVKYGQNAANEEEKRLIKQYDSFGPNGYNMTEGGYERLYKWTEKQRKAMGKRVSGKGNPMYGKIGELSPHYGKKFIKRRKTYEIFFKDGHIEIITGLVEFCNIRNYNIGGLQQVINGTYSHHKDIIKIKILQ